MVQDVQIVVVAITNLGNVKINLTLQITLFVPLVEELVILPKIVWAKNQARGMKVETNLLWMKNICP